MPHHGGGTERPEYRLSIVSPRVGGRGRLGASKLPARVNKDGKLTDEECAELEEFERLEHFGRMLKARLRQRQSR